MSLLEGRLAYRRHWIESRAPWPRHTGPKALAWEIEYDLEHNFAHMGAEFVDEAWGRPKPRAARRVDAVRSVRLPAQKKPAKRKATA